MGRIVNHCIVVSGHNDGEWLDVSRAHLRAQEIFAPSGKDENNSSDYRKLITPIVSHAANAGASFLIGVDGSKEGWGTSNDVRGRRKTFVEYLRATSLDWALIRLGDDDHEDYSYKVEAAPDFGLDTDGG